MFFFDAGGFKDHMSIPSGDDDLFINQVANRGNTSICYHPDSRTESLPKATFKSWFHQKRRHISTAKHYKTSHKAALGLFYITQLLFPIFAVWLLLIGNTLELIIALVVLRYVMFYIAQGMAARKLGNLDLLLLTPVLELFLVLTQLVIFISNLTSKQSHWK